PTRTYLYGSVRKETLRRRQGRAIRDRGEGLRGRGRTDPQQVVRHRLPTAGSLHTGPGLLSGALEGAGSSPGLRPPPEPAQQAGGGGVGGRLASRPLGGRGMQGNRRCLAASRREGGCGGTVGALRRPGGRG